MIRAQDVVRHHDHRLAHDVAAFRYRHAIPCTGCQIQVSGDFPGLADELQPGQACQQVLGNFCAFPDQHEDVGFTKTLRQHFQVRRTVRVNVHLVTIQQAKTVQLANSILVVIRDYNAHGGGIFFGQN